MTRFMFFKKIANGHKTVAGGPTLRVCAVLLLLAACMAEASAQPARAADNSSRKTSRTHRRLPPVPASLIRRLPACLRMWCGAATFTVRLISRRTPMPAFIIR